MKRELKPTSGLVPQWSSTQIAEPIPMKRELKLDRCPGSVPLVRIDCRAYPDEKGIETKMTHREFVNAMKLQSLSR